MVYINIVLSLALSLVGCVNAPMRALASTSSHYPAVSEEHVRGLVAMHLPHKHSYVNCFGAAFAAAKVSSVLIAQHNSTRYFTEKCFLQVDTPQAGDLAFVIASTPDFHNPNERMIWHSFVTVGKAQVFQKGNPGWNEYPFELTTTEKALKRYRGDLEKNTATLVWARYTPNSGCSLTRFEDWLKENLVNSRFSKAISAVEDFARGITPKFSVDRAVFLDTVKVIDELIPRRKDPLTDMILALMHEYFTMAPLNSQRIEFEHQQLDRAHAHLNAYVNAADPSVTPKLRSFLNNQKLCYHLQHFARSDEQSNSAYLFSPSAAEAWKFTSDDFRGLSARGYKTTFKPLAPDQLSPKFAIENTATGEVWEYGFSTGSPADAPCVDSL